MTKKLIALLLATVMLLSFAACGKEDAKTDETTKAASDKANADKTETLNTIVDEPGYVFKNDGSRDLGTPDKAVDPQSIYDNLEYNEKMFMGTYTSEKGLTEEGRAKFAEEVGLISYATEYAEQLSALPYKFECGINNLMHRVNDITAHEWMRMYFCTEDGYTYMLGAYTVEGNKLTFTPLDSYEIDEASKKITYSLKKDSFVYDFQFDGLTLTLSSGDKSVELRSDILNYEEEVNEYIYVDNYLLADSKRLDDVDYLSFRFDSEDNSSRIYIGDVNEDTIDEAIAKLSKNGRFTITIPYESGTKTYQFAAFYCGKDGIILTDGKTTYYYCDTAYSRDKYEIGQFVSEDVTGQLGALTEGEIEEIAKKKDELIADLIAKFNSAGIDCTYNEITGEFAVDSSILFGGDSAELSAEGKAFLDKFIKAYMEVIYDEKYDGFISSTVIEGHTAPLSGSTYESGLPLSVERAENVMNYCLNAESLDDTEKALLTLLLEAEGLSNSRPILDADGNVDLAASRRVSFRFNIDIDSYL